MKRIKKIWLVLLWSRLQLDYKREENEFGFPLCLKLGSSWQRWSASFDWLRRTCSPLTIRPSLSRGNDELSWKVLWITLNEFKNSERVWTLWIELLEPKIRLIIKLFFCCWRILSDLIFWGWFKNPISKDFVAVVAESPNLSGFDDKESNLWSDYQKSDPLTLSSLFENWKSPTCMV